ncbi:multidrug effflux MFS transporter [Gluconacetobacter asukensis]|uniref:Bcr/CflA family efflux transporter n=1 Tax=Gluconacetobacter asukensis TaxID=1017181 RepID=A0A7W4IWY1_9PROT|nr:multidrug effflux MFS transporter [Gluconacetobacter asukensis]MBB2170571.1 multidrug effflux MFS transporter [Gluconacetobacter asukensis]
MTHAAPGQVAERPEDVETAGTIQAARQEAIDHRWWVLGILSLLMGFASISTDLYLPAMPAMGQALGASPGLVEWTVSGYLIGFSFGQLFWGPVSDRHGRRLPVALGLVLFILGSAGCAVAGSGATLIGWRILQAAGASAGVVLSRAMVRDLYAGHRAVQMLSTLITVMAIAPLLGPIVGGQILLLGGWRAIFWTLVGVGMLTLAAVPSLPETLAPAYRNHEPLTRALLRYGELLKQPRLLGYAGAGGFFYGGMFAYVAGTPFAYITYHHVPARLYGLLFALGIVGIMATNTVNSRLAARVGGDRLLVLGAIQAALSGLLVAGAAWTGQGGLWGLVVPLFLFASTTGFIVANSIAGALNGFPERAGAVSALVGAMQYGSGILGSGLVGAFADGTPWPMGWVIALSGVGSLLCTRLVHARPGKTTSAPRHTLS